MQGRGVGQRAVGTKPHVFDGVRDRRVERVFANDRAKLDRFCAQQFFAHRLRDQVRTLANHLQLGRQVFRANHIGHCCLMLKPHFVVLERSAAGENRLALLNGRYPAGAETAAVAHAVNLINHGQAGIAGAQKITVH